MRPGQFQCGCDLPEWLLENWRPDPSDERLKTNATVVVDDEGWITCLVHGVRPYGWRSGYVVQTPNGPRHTPQAPLDVVPSLTVTARPEIDRRENSPAKDWVEEPTFLGSFGNGRPHIVQRVGSAHRPDIYEANGAPVCQHADPDNSGLCIHCGKVLDQSYREFILDSEKQVAREEHVG